MVGFAVRHGAKWDADEAGHGRSFGPQGLLQDSAFQRGFLRLAPLGLSFDAWVFYHQLGDAAALLETFPETTVVLDHCGGLLRTEPHTNHVAVLEIRQRNVEKLARFANLAVKIGGLGMLYLAWDFHLRDAPPSSEELADAWRPYVETCIRSFRLGTLHVREQLPHGQTELQLCVAVERVQEDRCRSHTG